MYIYTKRIDHKTLVVIRQNYGRCQVLFYKGKRADFTEFSKAKAKVWQLEKTQGAGAEWGKPLLKKELEERINARLDRALAKTAAESSQEKDDDDRGERDMLARQYYRNMANELASEPEFLDDSEEQDVDALADWGL